MLFGVREAVFVGIHIGGRYAPEVAGAAGGGDVVGDLVAVADEGGFEGLAVVAGVAAVEEAVLFAVGAGPAEVEGGGREGLGDAVSVAVGLEGGAVGDGGPEDAGDAVEGICPGGGFFGVGPAVVVRVGLGIELGGKELLVVVLFFPKVAQAVAIDIEDGVGLWREEKTEACGCGEESEIHWAPPCAAGAAGSSVRQ